MPKPLNLPLTEVPPAVFSRMLATRLDRTDREQRQLSPVNDGRTGYIVNYFGKVA